MRNNLVFLALGAFLGTGCVTVNINFPAKEVEKAAEVIVGEARPLDKDGDDPKDDHGGTPTEKSSRTSPSAPKEDSTGAPGEHPSVQALRGGGKSILVAFEPPQEKKDTGREDDIKVDINTPLSKAIRESFPKRFPKLRPFYDKGAIGENLDGYIEVRDDAKLSLVEKRDMKALVDEDNRDRKNLYLEIVRANRFDESRLKDVQHIFGKAWIKRAATGWWIQSPDGKWIRKPPPPKEEKKEDKKPEKKGAAA